MLVQLRHRPTDVILPFVQFGAVVLALSAGEGPGAVTGLGVLLATGLIGWKRALRHARLIADTPTSRIASAAQGYTELRGRGQPLDGTPLRSPINGLPVLWYRVLIEQRQRDGKWKRETVDESDASFLLEDASGQCVVNPEGADMMVKRCDVVRRGDMRYTQWSLIRHDRIYVLGDFATLGSVNTDFDFSAQVRELLASWKADHPGLLARFDLDGNGEIDVREWELARSQARREVRRLHEEVMAAPEVHVMRRPTGRRLYLISDHDPARIARRYRALAIFHAAVVIAAAAATAWFAQIGVF
ncbi:hypothetical protein [Thauera mechernichensis]